MNPCILVYGSQDDAFRATDAGHGAKVLRPLVEGNLLDDAQEAGAGRPLILLGLGYEGCAAVARRCARCARCHGRGLIDADLGHEGGIHLGVQEVRCPSCNGQPPSLHDVLRGVVAVVLVGPAAALRGREARRGELAAGLRICLNELEPMRAVAKSATEEVREGDDRGYPLRLVVTTHPDADRCGACHGKGRYRIHADPNRWTTCVMCSGTTHLLRSSEIGAELIEGAPTDPMFFVADEHGRAESCAGGLLVISFSSRADHDAHAIGAALKRVLE